MDDALASFAGTLRRLRNERNLTQDVLAQRAAMDPAELRRIEAAKRDPGVRVVVRLARGLGVAPSDLFKELDSPDAPT